jgi:hypothetical protein
VYADDLVLLAPSWHALQKLLCILEDAANKINLIVNAKKTVCMIFNPTCKSKIVSDHFQSTA